MSEQDNWSELYSMICDMEMLINSINQNVEDVTHVEEKLSAKLISDAEKCVNLLNRLHTNISRADVVLRKSTDED